MYVNGLFIYGRLYTYNVINIHVVYRRVMEGLLGRVLLTEQYL